MPEPDDENPILFLQGVKLTTEQFNAIFTFYDKVGDIVVKVVITHRGFQFQNDTTICLFLIVLFLFI